MIIALIIPSDIGVLEVKIMAFLCPSFFFLESWGERCLPSPRPSRGKFEKLTQKVIVDIPFSIHSSLIHLEHIK